jgi:hypothetical protein
VQFDVGSAMKAKIELALALASHSNRSGDLAMMFERALDVYVEQLQKRRFARTDRPRTKRKAAQEPVRDEKEQATEPDATEREAPRARTHIPHDTRRAVVARDGMQCTFVGPSGERCDERAFLQFDHDDPWGKGGDEEPGNLRMRCREHNRLHAEEDYGRAHVARRIDEARKKRAS